MVKKNVFEQSQNNFLDEDPSQHLKEGHPAADLVKNPRFYGNQ
jgi:hypothetical protein